MYDNAIFYTGEKPVKLKKWNRVENRISISDQAKLYVEWIKENNKTDLWFFPLKQSENATANKFRTMVLNLICGHSVGYFPPYPHDSRSWRALLESNLIERGYTINTYRPE